MTTAGPKSSPGAIASPARQAQWSPHFATPPLPPHPPVRALTPATRFAAAGKRSLQATYRTALREAETLVETEQADATHQPDGTEGTEQQPASAEVAVLESEAVAGTEGGDALKQRAADGGKASS